MRLFNQDNKIQKRQAEYILNFVNQLKDDLRSNDKNVVNAASATLASLSSHCKNYEKNYKTELEIIEKQKMNATIVIKDKENTCNLDESYDFEQEYGAVFQMDDITPKV